MSAAGVLRHEGFPYALDNGAWSAFTQGRPFDDSAFVRALRLMGAHADWTVIPDIVAGGAASLDLSLRWMRVVLDESPMGMIAVQDGMAPADVSTFIGARVGIFVGGSTAWKLSTMAAWSALARSKEAWCHIGRVNSARRIGQVIACGAHSFDGTSATKFAVTIPKLTHARDQLSLLGET